jgi:hypothetical protein
MLAWSVKQSSGCNLDTDGDHHGVDGHTHAALCDAGAPPAPLPTAAQCSGR